MLLVAKYALYYLLKGEGHQRFLFECRKTFELSLDHRPHGRAEFPTLPRTGSTEFEPLEDKQVEYFFASDASAIIEHTNRVIYFEVGLAVRSLKCQDVRVVVKRRTMILRPSVMES